MKISGEGIRETLGFLGVIASLVFVGVEVRQNTIVARSAAYQDIGLATMEGWREQALDREWAELNVLGSDSSKWSQIDDAGWLQLRWRVLSGMRGWENVYLQVEQGLLPAEAMTRFGYDVDPRVYWPYFDRLWPSVRTVMHPAFVEYMVQEFGLPRR